MIKLIVKNGLVTNHEVLNNQEKYKKHISSFMENDYEEGEYFIEELKVQKIDLERKNDYILIISEIDKKKRDLILAGEMTAGLIHDINNQLGLVIAGTEMLKAFKDDNPIVMKQVKNIGIGVNSIVSMVTGASSLFKTEKTIKSEICIKHLLEVVTKTSKSFLHGTDIELSYNITTTMDNFKGIDSQLMRVLTNMIKNSKDAVKDLAPHRRWIELKAYDDDNFVYIQVKDGGNGIKEDIQSKIFEPFFSTKKEGEGSGIGLDVCKKIAKDHGGDILIENTNKYTGFVFSISKK